MSEMEDLRAKHRKEQRDLQSRITQKKKTATKKTRKGVNDECDRLQRELLEKQKTEISRFNGEPEVLADKLDNLDLEDSLENGGSPDKSAKSAGVAASSTQDESTPLPSEASRAKKGNRQKARLARRAAEREADAEKAADEAAKATDHRGNERKIISDILSRLGLKEIEIEPDGHCLYAAVANQLVETGTSLTPGKKADDAQPKYSKKKDSYRDVRTATAEFILANSDDFAPFLEEPIEAYARNIKLTTEWGGQLELQAIARAYGLRINVVQGNGRVEKFDPEASDGPDDNMPNTIWLAYYRHYYGLGEHYNALAKRK